ncbi:MAG: twin-arginine translocase TatA/TatE family subunit [Pirellulales bacterium]|nr:twin-arginine translocase TatA/TatE family subunit [Pirellulales bacterium]
MFLASPHDPLLAMWSPGPGEMLLLAVIALLLYGGELPEKARHWGKAFAEFRRNLSGIQNDINSAIYAEPPKPQRLQHYPEFRDVEPLTPAASPAADPLAEQPPADAPRPDEPTD